MAIITIARQEGSLSNEIALELASRLGCQCVANDLIVQELTTKYGIDEKAINKYDEKKPGLLASLTNQHDKYNNYFKLYFLEKAISSPKCILLGRGGAFFLRNVPGVLRIRVVGNENLRVRRMMKIKNIDEKAARKHVALRDNERAGYTRFFYNMSWDDPGSYDIVINTDNLTPDTIAAFLEGTINHYETEEYTEKLVTRLNELYIAQKLTIHLLYEEKIPIHFLEVDVQGDHVILMGTVEVQGLIEQAGVVASQYPGIRSVDNKIVFVSSYPPMA